MPLVSARQVRDAKAEEDEAIAEAIASLSGGCTGLNFGALSAEQKIDLIRALIADPSSNHPAAPRDSSEAGLLSRIASPSSPFHALWWVPALLWLSGILPFPGLAGLVPTVAWAAAAVIGLHGLSIEFHLRTAAVWQAVLAWPYAENIWNGASAGQAFPQIASDAGPLGVSMVAAAAAVCLGTMAWDCLSD